MFPLPLHIYFEVGAFLFSLICWKDIRHTPMRWFMPFLLIICIVELTARYLAYEHYQPNAWLYCLSVPLEYTFYTFIFINYYRREWFKKAGYAFIILFVAYALYSNIFLTGLKFFDFRLLIIGSLAMIFFCILYFIELYARSLEHPITQIPMFWVAFGVFLFNTGEFCYNLLAGLVDAATFDETLKVFRSINNRLILVLYSSFIIAFLCQKIFGTYKRDSATM